MTGYLIKDAGAGGETIVIRSSAALLVLPPPCRRCCCAAPQPARRDHDRARGLARRHRSLAGARAIAAAGGDRISPSSAAPAKTRPTSRASATWSPSLLDDGAGDLDAKAFQQRLEDNAVELRSRSSRDYFTGSIRLLRDRQDKSFDLLRLALKQPRFDADAIERIRAQIMAGLRRETTNPNSIASRTWWRAAYPNHPYGQPEGGSLESVPTITADDLRSYTRNGCSRAAISRSPQSATSTPPTLGQMLDRVFGALPATGKLTAVPDQPPKALGQRTVVQLDVPQAVVYMGGVGSTRKDPDFMPAYVVNHILGGGSFTSRLYNEVREKRGLAYGVYSYLSDDQARRHARWHRPRRAPTSTGQALGLIETEIHRMVEDGPTADELAKAKDYLKGSYALNFDTSAKIASILLQSKSTISASTTSTSAMA